MSKINYSVVLEYLNSKYGDNSIIDINIATLVADEIIFVKGVKKDGNTKMYAIDTNSYKVFERSLKLRSF